MHWLGLAPSHWTHFPALKPLELQTGVGPEQSPDLHARQVSVALSQIGVGEEQSVSVRQPSHRPLVMSQMGVGAAQDAAPTPLHGVQDGGEGVPGAQRGATPMHSPFAFDQPAVT